jgi:hypothetical protein
MTNHGEPLARGAAEYNVHMCEAYPSPLPDLGAGQSSNRLRQHDAMREVVCMDSAMDGVDFDCGHDIETSLLEAQSKASSAGKQIDSDRSWHL